MKFLCHLAIVALQVLPCPAEPVALFPPPRNEGNLAKVPRYLRNRCTPELRLAAIQSRGGNPAAEQAVIDALRFLKDTQDENGSWAFGRPVGMTSLALLCFLGHGETTQSEEFGSTVKEAMQFLIDTAVKHRGKLALDPRYKKWTYQHAIGTYALAEAYALCRQGRGEEIPQLKRAVEVCGQIIINSQHQSGGWDYQYSEDNGRGGDVSQTTWHLLALKACRLTDCTYATIVRSSKNGLDYIERMQMVSGAIGYSSPNRWANQDGTTLTALGATCFQIWDSPASRVARKAVRFIDTEMKFDWNSPDSDLYGLFFASQTMFRNGGPEWERYQKMVFPQVLENQAPGGFFLAPNHGEIATIRALNGYYALATPASVHYRTCLATLTLETYYRIRFPTP